MMADQTTTATTARTLAKQGYGPLPLPARRKSPPPDGYTGYRGRMSSVHDVDRWEHQNEWGGNLGLRLPPDVCGIDVDAYKGGSITPLEEQWGNLPPTVWSTSRHDGSGIALFRIPNGTTLRANPANGIDIIQHSHRYMVVAPSIHPDTGDTYEWFDEETQEVVETPPDIENLPELPWAWVEGLSTIKGQTAAAASSTEVDTFVRTTTTGLAPGRLRGIERRLADHHGSRHDTLIEVACWAMREAAAGAYTADAAINTLERWWRSVMDNTERLNGPEFGDAIRWAVAQVKLDPKRVEQIRTEMVERRPESIQRATEGPQSAAPTGVNPLTGEIVKPTNLPDDFWNARPELTHIRQAAHNRLVSADAVLIATLARITTLIPACYVLPPIVGGHVSLNLFGSILDPSGGGKSAAASVARQLVPINRKDIVDPILPSSGEGLIEAFMGWVDTEDPDTGKKRKERQQTHKAGFAWVDEGQGLLAQADRSGSTIMETIRSAWMGGDLGQHNASDDRKRWLKEHGYRLSMVIGFQLAFAADLIADGEGGTPQRFTFAIGTDPAIDPTARWPGALTLERFNSFPGLVDVEFDDDIADGIRQRRLDRSRGVAVIDPLDTHADLRIEKLAAALAALDGRLTVHSEDWELAGVIDATSRAVRSMAVERARTTSQAMRETAIRRAVEQDERMEMSKVRRATEAAAKSIARRIWRHGSESLDGAWRQVHSRYRSVADRHDALAVAVEREWLADDGEVLHRGKADPR